MECEPQPPDPLDELQLHGRSVRQWHHWLTTDEDTGEPHGDDMVPCSRYGRDGTECAWWALACEAVYVEANGENSDEDPSAALTYYLGLAVNDHESVLELVRDYWYAIPNELKAYLDYEENGLNLPQQAALRSLCERYGVGYDPEHYAVNPDDAWMMPGWAEGWIGGVQTTIYVGVSPEGEVNS